MQLSYHNPKVFLLLIAAAVAVISLTLLAVIFAPYLGSRAARQAAQTTVEGTVEVWIGEHWAETAEGIGVDYEEKVYILRTDAGQRLRLSDFTPPAELQPNTRLRLQGRQVQGPNGPELQSTKAVGGTRGQVRGIASGSKRVAVVVLQYADAPHATTPATVGFARHVFFDGPQAVAKYYREASFGQLELTGDVLGPYTIPYGDINSRCYLGPIYAAEKEAEKTGINLNNYDYFQYILPDGSGCGQVNAWAMSSPGEISLIDKRWYLPLVAAHELGHNLGLGHAFAARCFENNEAVTIGLNCQPVPQEGLVGRGDVFDPMGSNRYFHFHNIHKEVLGWLQPHNIQDVATSGRYMLRPIEQASSGAQALRLAINIESRPSYLYLEYRRPYGFDAFQATNPVVNGVTLRLAVPNVGTYLLDATPDTTSLHDATLLPGQTVRIPQSSVCITPRTAAEGSTEIDIDFSCAASTPVPTPTTAQAQVRAAHLSYGGSSYLNDNLAIDPSKTPLRPAQSASFANISGHSRGINGLVIDIANLANDGISISDWDFEFRLGNSNEGSSWPEIFGATVLPVRPGAGQDGADRVRILFPDGMIINTWLAVTIKASRFTGLAEPYTFFYGSAVGETGATLTPNLIGADAADLQAIGKNLTPAGKAKTEPITNPYDLNKDKTVDAFDLQVVAKNLKPNILNLITPQ